MAFVIPDKVLEKMICDSCHKYLSVKPIKIFPNRRIKCGRCCRSKNQSGGVVSLYGLIADKCLFKCVNRFDGCKTLLTYEQVRDHEKVCIGKQYKCPICPESMDIVTYLMKKHFKGNHKGAILDHPGFYLKLDLLRESSVTYLYQQNEKLFFIILTSSPLNTKIELKAVYLGDPYVVKNINQQFTVSTEDTSEIISELKPCFAYSSADYDNFSINLPDTTKTIFIKFSITDDNETLMKLPKIKSVDRTNSISSSANEYTFVPMVKEGRVWKMFLTSQFIHRYPDFLLTPLANALIIRNSNRIYFIECSNCKELCWQGQSQEIFNRFYCHKKFNHSLCYYCFQFLKHKEEVSEDSYTNEEFPIEIIPHLRFFCKWNCGEVLDHNLTQDTNFHGIISDIILHMANHLNSIVYTYSNFLISSLSNKNIYLYLNERFVWIEVVVLWKTTIHMRAQMVCPQFGNRDCEKLKPAILLFDDNKKFENLLTDSIVFHGNRWVKVMLIEA